GLTEADVLLSVTTLSFDIAALELYLPLLRGARVALATRDEALDGQRLMQRMSSSGATVMQATPATWRLLLESGWNGNPRLKVLCGGEALSRNLADDLLRRATSVWNVYGPTETTVWSSAWRVEPGEGVISIGRPIANTQMWVLDARLQPMPVGVPGELCIGGVGVARGYWERPDLTAEKFVPDPLSGEAGSRLCRTGDLARWLPDGRLECLGRIDHQVKVRGFRIEPGEIEASIARHPAVREVVVIAREDTPGDKRLVAYLVADQPPADLADQLRALIRGACPEYMVPAHFVTLEALPRTANGKLDRKALPAPDPGAGVAPRAAAVAPRTPTEEMVMGLFQGVLERTDFGVGETFFDLGGHSLMAARLLSQLRAASGVDLPLRILFEHPSVAALAGALEALAWSAGGRPAEDSRDREAAGRRPAVLRARAARARRRKRAAHARGGPRGVLRGAGPGVPAGRPVHPGRLLRRRHRGVRAGATTGTRRSERAFRGAVRLPGSHLVPPPVAAQVAPAAADDSGRRARPGGLVASGGGARPLHRRADTAAQGAA